MTAASRGGPPDLALNRQVVVLTGASSGLGIQFARALDDAGARLVLVARRRERLEEVASTLSDALAVPCDVADPDAPRAIVRAALDRFDRIDGLVNNAGIANVTPALREAPDDFRRVVDVNLVGPFLLSQAVAQAMSDSGGGAIVNVTSVAGQLALRMVPQASYAASKAGLMGLTRELAAQWARYGIRVNAIAPGAFATEMTEDSFDEHGRLSGFIRQRVPAERPGRPGELDTMLLVLLHPSTSYVTGQVIFVDGGLTAS